jgi:SAM-dependent methyltransferase
VTFVAVSAAAGVLGAQDRPTKTLDIHYTPTRHAVADAMLDLAKVTAADVVYDLGSGDGRIPIIAAQKYGARGIGVELDGALVERSRQNARDAGVSHRVTFLLGDLFTADMSEATVITLYLSTSINAALEPRLRALRHGTRIVSHQFPIGRWAPDTTRQVDESTLRLWRVP